MKTNYTRGPFIEYVRIILTIGSGGSGSHQPVASFNRGSLLSESPRLEYLEVGDTGDFFGDIFK